MFCYVVKLFLKGLVNLTFIFLFLNWIKFLEFSFAVLRCFGYYAIYHHFKSFGLIYLSFCSFDVFKVLFCLFSCLWKFKGVLSLWCYCILASVYCSKSFFFFFYCNSTLISNGSNRDYQNPYILPNCLRAS